MPENSEWKIGDSVQVTDVTANEYGKQEPCTWSGTGTIDMIQHGGDYIRVVSGPYIAWVNSDNFDRVTKISIHPEIDPGPAIGMEFPNDRPDPTEDQIEYARELAEQTRQGWKDHAEGGNETTE